MANLLSSSKAIRDRIVLYTMETEEDDTPHTVDDLWPFVTISDFEARHIDYFRFNQGATQLDLIPLVSKQDKTKYQEFTVKNQNWIQQGLDFRSSYYDQLEHNSTSSSTGTGSILDSNRNVRQVAKSIPSFIHIGTDDSDGWYIEDPVDHSLFAPIWQTAPAPAIPARVNFNLLSINQIKDGFHWVQATQLPVMTESSLVEDLPSTLRHSPREVSSSPQGFLLEPVFNTIESHNHGLEDDHEDQKDMVGFICITIDWSRFFDGILPPGASNVVVVMSNTCGQTYTFVLNGSGSGSGDNGESGAYFLGVGDLHDPNHEQNGETVDLITDETVLDNHVYEAHEDFIKEASSHVNHGQHSHDDTTTPSIMDFCPYSIQIYPTPELRRSYNSNQPLIFTASVVFIFVLATALFLIYDCMAEARQNVVTKTAARANALVGSLFPEQIQNRLMDATELVSGGRVKGKSRKGSDKKEKDLPGNDRYKQLVKAAMGSNDGGGEQTKELPDEDNDNVIAFHSKPIADLFPATTIMFCKY